ncbi:MAG: SusD/RagB family nutrient-binding outer membrane lipoprotein [Saprospiraceae bacterium]|jgi:hypothetical protein|nr:SusD/RagB family nutrient-binding outer membrane lipoprotein [Saprospiraceae bacterium]MBP9209980.1 SusD/RagB family nutrient-binding outer membrane lipoprotein [Saprospiraceae bacterium]MBV6473233.1 hypothetical protein [Saprospiraceae bacterium]
MKKYLFLLLCVAFATACTDNFDELNTDKKNPSNVTPGSLFAGSERNLVDLMTNGNVNINIFRFLPQYWTETTYTDEVNYDLSTRNIPQNFWNDMFLDVLKGLDECADKIPSQNDAFFPAPVKKNQNACVEILAVYAFATLVNTFGNIPYSQALDFNNVYPVYDDAKTVYGNLLDRLETALGDISTGDAGFGSNDLLFGGDMARWKMLGNSMLARMAMIIADDDAAKSKGLVEKAYAGGIVASAADNIAFQYLSSPPNTNPIWVDLVQSGRKDFVAANTLVDFMKNLSDPRIPGFFTQDAAGDYSGGIYGASNNYATFSKPSEALTAPDYPSTLVDYSEMEFLLAEAVERGMSIPGTAEEHYNNAVRASILAWGGSDADADAYLANPAVAYSTASGDYKQKIGTQKWLALYNRGFEAWTEWRRLDAPTLVAPAAADSDIPKRYTYPVQEQNLNTANYNAASTAIGGDKVTTKLFWDKF